MQFLIRVSIVVCALISSLLAFWSIRNNTAEIAPNLIQSVSKLPKIDRHNAFTDLVAWRGAYYLSYRTASNHRDKNEAKIVVLRSEKGNSWRLVKSFKFHQRDIRDPKFAVIKNKLFVYFLLANQLDDSTTTTFYSFTPDGSRWLFPKAAKPSLKRFWRPKSRDQETWYVPVFRDEKTDLYKTQNGEDWKFVSTIYTGPGADETAIEFLSDGRLIASVREQTLAYQGDNQKGTLILESSPPYQTWSLVARTKNRLDGPALFSHAGNLYALGRRQVDRNPFLHQMGSGFARKRTSLFVWKDKDWRHLSDLPSGGDTSYPGVVLRKDGLLISYYTNDPQGDLPWYLGMFAPTQVMLARLHLPTPSLPPVTSHRKSDGTSPHGMIFDPSRYINQL